MKCENSSEQKDYNIDSDQYINDCDIGHIEGYNRAFILRKFDSALKLGKRLRRKTYNLCKQCIY